MKNLKYPLYLFLLILFSKLGYIVVESFYNYYVLTITTSASLSKDAIEELNTNGHRISAIGITLLLIPFLYLFVRNLNKKVMIGLLIILSISTYFIAFSTLNIVVDKIVETNKDKRHDAYYVNIFKYGILNNIFAYNSFIDNNKIKNNNIDVNDRILLTNTFLLLHADKELINKLKNRGKEKVADLYIDRNLKDDFQQKYELFKKASDNISKLWNELNHNKIKLKSNILKLEQEKYIKETYDKFVKNLKLSYSAYKIGWEEVDKKILEETSPSKISQIENNLKKYFRYQRYEKAKKQYRQNMQDNFGHYIKPNVWKDASGQISSYHINEVIKNEILKEANKRLGKTPKNLSVKKYMYHYETKLAVMKKLKQNGILIPYEFNYSYKQFKHYYKIMATKKISQIYDDFYTKLKDKIGINDIKLNMRWKDFIYSNYIKSKIANNFDNTNINNILKALYSKDLSNFRKLVYLPTIKDKVNDMMYKKADFKDGGKASIYGDEAIKLLYIPPFALSVSIIALLLNIITVFGMLLSIVKLSSIKVKMAQTTLALMIILIPILLSNNSFDNKMIQQSIGKSTKAYLDFLSWISFYEKLNSRLHG